MTAMNKYTIRVAAFFLIIALAVLVISQHQLIGSLQEKVQSLAGQNQQLAGLLAEKERLAGLAPQNPPAPVQSTEPSMELLRLRGQVSRLSRDQAESDELRRQVETLSLENRLLRFPTLNDTYFLDGLDTNSLPQIDLGFSRDKVSAELQRVGAKILAEDGKYIQAEALPAVLGRSNASFATIKMELYFDEGKLIQRRDNPHIPK